MWCFTVAVFEWIVLGLGVGFMVIAGWVGFANEGAAATDTRFHRDDLTADDHARVKAVIAPTKDFTTSEKFEKRQAGAPTFMGNVNANAFSNPSANLTFEGEQDFKLGNGLFKKLWVSSPSSTQASDGLGPLYNARSCQRCHLKDGRGHPPSHINDSAVSMFLRLSVPPRTDEQRRSLIDRTKQTIPEPVYGGQLQDFAVPGLPAEGRMVINYEEVIIALNGGESVKLRKPTYTVAVLGFGPIAKDVLLSPRVAPPMIGLGLLEAIHPADIIAQADEDDADHDGISGKPSWVKVKSENTLTLGRFGWKASTATILQQSADAFAGDIGISSPSAGRHWGDCTRAQVECLKMVTGVQKRLGDTEAPEPVLGLVTFYSKNLAVPARRNVDHPSVLRGKQVFYETGCVACHTPKYVTSRNAVQAAHRFQLIWPYTDMLLHDMGEGLSDNRPVGDATGNEWRTPPLWGIGLTKTVNGHTNFLHDGRARSLLEAILWHGGEALDARESVIALDPTKRADLLRFLESL